MSPVNFIGEGVTIGQNVKIWHFAVILDGVVIEDDVSIGSHAEIGRGSHIGNGARIGQGVFLPSNSRIAADVFIGPNTVFCDDKYPRVANSNYHAQPPVIDYGASIGAGCVILPGVRIGAQCMIGAGSVITSDVLAGTIIYGEPARVKLNPRLFPNVAQRDGRPLSLTTLST